MAAKTKAFSKELWDGFDLVTKLTADGVHSAQEMQKFLKEVAEIEAEYSKKLIRACKVHRGEQASNKLFGTLAKSSGYGAKMVNRLKSGFRGKREQGSLKNAWMTVLDSVEKAAKSHAQYSTDISTTILTGMNAWTKDRQAQQRLATTEGAHASRDYYDAKAALARAKKSYIKLAKDLESNEAAYDAAVSDGRKEAAKYITKVNALKPKVADAESDYKQATEAANRVQTAYYTKIIPGLLDNLQVFEVDRIQRLTKYLTEFTKMRKAVAKAETDMLPVMNKALGAVSADNDIAAFVAKNRTGGSLPDAFEAKAAKELSPTAVFGVGLDDVMAVQKDQAPPDTKIPYVVVVITRRIEELEGAKTEGIFRISGSAGEVRQMRRELDKGNYGAVDLVQDVHAVAALLKQWLRDLPDPLIPSAQYSEALKVSNDSDKAIALVRNLPETNRRTLTHIMKFLATIDEDESLMSPDNLAMVFSPCLLRSPASQGPESLLLGAGGTHAFVKTLVEHIKIKTKEGPPGGGAGGGAGGDGGAAAAASAEATTAAAGARGTWEGNGTSPVPGTPLGSSIPSPHTGSESGGSGSGRKSRKGGGSPRRRTTNEKRDGSKGSRGSRRKKGGSSHHSAKGSKEVKPASPTKPSTLSGT